MQDLKMKSRMIRRTRSIRDSFLAVMSVSAIALSMPALCHAQPATGGTVTNTDEQDQPITTKAPQPRLRPKPTAQMPSIAENTGTALGDGLIVFDNKVGSGTELQAGDAGIFLYTGWVKESKTQFSTNRRGSLTQLVMSVPSPRLIAGWNRGLLGMKAGGRRLLAVPAALGYGERGYSAISIPPDADLFFEVELMGVIRRPAVDLTDGKEWEDGARSKDLTIGEGPAFEENCYGTFHVTWWNPEGAITGTSHERVEPVVMRFDATSGWSKYTTGMKSGGQRAVAATYERQIGRGAEVQNISEDRVYLIEAVEIYAPLTPPAFAEKDLVDVGEGLKYVDIEVGKGEELPKYSSLEINFTGWRDDGTVFDTTLAPGGTPRTVSADWDLLVWGKGTRGMRIGTKRLIFCPPAYAYTEEGSDTLRIDPNESLVYYVELRGFEMPLFLPEEAMQDEEFMKIWNAKFGEGNPLFGDIDEDEEESDDDGG